jgi:hypothetical protein
MITVRRDVRGKLAAPKQLALPAPTLVQQPTGQLPAPREQTLLLSSGATPGRRGFGALVRQLLGLSSAA